MLSATPSPALRWRGCTVPGEGWSPAETEHFGEARWRRCTAVWRLAQRSSPIATERPGTRTECVSIGVGSWTRHSLIERVSCGRCATAFEPGAIPGTFVDHDDGATRAGNDHDRGCTTHDHDDRGPGTGDDHHGGSGSCGRVQFG
jgi:hypothetical protein